MNHTAKPRTKTPIRIGITLTLLLFVALASTQAATAQIIPVGCDVFAQSNLSLTGAIIELPPGGHGSTQIEYEYNAPELAFSLSPVAIDFHFAGVPAWANAVLFQNTVFVEVPPAEATKETGAIDIAVSLHQDAPEGEWAVFEVQVDASEGTCVTSASADTNIMIGVVADQAEAQTEQYEKALEAEATQNSIPAPAMLTPLVALLALVAAARRRG